MEEPDSIELRLNAIESILPELEATLSKLQQGELSITTKQNAFDLVTQADLLSETTLVNFIQEHFPTDSILAEEGTEENIDSHTGKAFQWVLDPIDGTINYANRLPIWSISIGLRRGDTTVGALVRGPGLALRYRAILGKGATCNEVPIQVNGKSSLAEGVVVTGFPYDRAKRAKPLCQALENILHKVGGVRRFGSAALDFCLLADGRMTGYYEMGLKPWDYAAGLLIATEAGAQVTDFEGEPVDIFKSAGIVAATPACHAELLETVAPIQAAIAIN